ncbi:MAG: hypothetical protein ACOX5R_03335 [bacterium]|jgi:hypothetical protein
MKTLSIPIELLLQEAVHQNRKNDSRLFQGKIILSDADKNIHLIELNETLCYRENHYKYLVFRFRNESLKLQRLFDGDYVDIELHGIGQDEIQRFSESFSEKEEMPLRGKIIGVFEIITDRLSYEDIWDFIRNIKIRPKDINICWMILMTLISFYVTRLNFSYDGKIMMILLINFIVFILNLFSLPYLVNDWDGSRPGFVNFHETRPDRKETISEMEFPVNISSHHRWDYYHCCHF